MRRDEKYLISQGQGDDLVGKVPFMSSTRSWSGSNPITLVLGVEVVEAYLLASLDVSVKFRFRETLTSKHKQRVAQSIGSIHVHTYIIEYITLSNTHSIYKNE